MKIANKHKYFVRIVLSFVIGGMAFLFLCVSQRQISMAAIMPSANGATNNNQRIVQEVAKAFYLKGDKIQYEGSRSNQFVAPEDITEQSSSYMVCSWFTFAVYYNAFGLVIPQTTSKINSYGKSYYGKTGHSDVVLFRDLTTLSTSTADKKAFKSELLTKLQVGDVITYFDSVKNKGHATLVYDFEYDATGNKTNAIILHSTSNWVKGISKLTNGIGWNSKAPNSITGIDEGTVQYIKLDSIINGAVGKKDYFTVYRPLAINKNNNRSYNRVACGGSGAIDKITCSSELSTFEQKTSSSARLQYPGIQIEKTVDAFNGNVVEPGDTLTYDIAITNNSNANYQNISIIENIPSSLISADGGAAQLNWTIGTIRAGATYHHKYSVKVKEDESLEGQEIISTGSVAGIPSATITNTIGRNLNSEEKTAVVAAYNNLKNTYRGAELIDKIYETAMDYSLNLKNAKLWAHHNKSGNSANIKNGNINCNPYYEASDSGALLKNQSGSYNGKNAMLNAQHKLAKNVLSNYYSALVFTYEDITSCSYKNVLPKFWSAYKDDPAAAELSDRATRVYPESLQTGDVLIYANTGTTKEGEDSVTHENGTYAFIWIEDGTGGGNFYGVNSLASGTALNMISGVNNGTANSLQTLFGKDYYAILRPSLTIPREAPDEPTPVEPEPDEPTPVEPEPDEPTPYDADPEDLDPDAPESDEAIPDDPEPDTPTPAEPEPDGSDDQEEIPASSTNTDDKTPTAPNTGKNIAANEDNQEAYILVISTAVLASSVLYSKRQKNCKKIGFNKK